MQAKAVSASNPDQAKVLYDVDANDGNDGSTFVTGIGIPGKKTKTR